MILNIDATNDMLLTLSVQIASTAKDIESEAYKKVAQANKDIEKKNKNGIKIPLDIGSQKLVQEMLEMKKKLKGLDLTEQFTGVADALNSGKASMKEYKEAISQMFKEVKLLYDFASKRENSAAMKALASFDVDQLNRVIQQLQIVKNKEAEVFAAREKAITEIATIQNKAGVSKARVIGAVSSRDLKVPTPDQLGQVMGLDEEQVKSTREQLTNYGRLCAYAVELLRNKSDLAQIDTTKNQDTQLKAAREHLTINTQLLDVYKQISTLENTIQSKTGLKSSQMMSKNVWGELNESSLQKAVKDSENVYNTIFTTPAQNAFDEIRQKLNTLIDKELGKVQRVLEKTREKTSAKAGSGSGSGSGTGPGAEQPFPTPSSTPIDEYIVDAEACIDKIVELQDEINSLYKQNKDIDKPFEEQLKYYARLKEITNWDDERIAKELVGVKNDHLEYLEDTLQNLDSVSSSTQKAIKGIQSYKEEVVKVAEASREMTQEVSQQVVQESPETAGAGTGESTHQLLGSAGIDLAELQALQNALADLENQIALLSNKFPQLFTETDVKVKELNTDLELVVKSLDQIQQLNAQAQTSPPISLDVQKPETGSTEQAVSAAQQEVADFNNLNAAISQVDQSIIQKNNDLVKESTIANRTIGIELPLFEKLKNKIEEVRTAIKNKTEELLEEGRTADSVIQGEITAFQPLEALITNISNGLSNIVTQLSQLSASGLTNIPINVYPSDQVSSRIQDIDLAWEEANIENKKFDNAKKQREKAQKEAQHLKEVKKQYAELMRMVKEYEQVRIRIAKGKEVSGDEQLKTQLTKDLAAQRKLIKQQQLFDNDLNDTYVNYLKSIKSKEKTALSGQKTQKQNELKKYNEKQIDKFTAKQDAAINKTEEYSNLIKELEGKLQELQKYESLDLLDPQNTDDVKSLKTEISKLFAELANPDFNIIDTEKIRSAQTSWENWRKNNTKANGQFKTELDAISAKYKQFATATKVSQKDWEELNAEVIKLKNNITKAGKTGQSFFDIWKGRMKSLFAWLSSFVGFQEVIQVVRTGVGYVKDLDAAMTDLRKVSDASTKELDDFQKSAAGIASDLAAATNTVVQATTEWSRLGYAIDEATKLAEASTIYANVGDIDATTASTDLVSAMKAFDIEAENAMKIVDSLNEIGNNYAVSSAQLGEILEKSSSALAVSGDSIDQVIAMGAAMNEIVQDSSITGTTLKMLSLRIRGASTEIEEMGESTDGMAESASKLREQIKALTNTNGTGGFDIMLDDKTFKTTYDILKGISKEWANMDQIDQSALLELIAGKNRAQGAAALIKNFSKAEDALKDSLNSAGSAAEENERFMESIEGHLNVLNNEYQRLWTEGINKDFINFWIDSGTAIMEVVNNIGLLDSALGGLTIVAGAMMTKDGNGFASVEGVKQMLGWSNGTVTNNGWLVGWEQLNAQIDEYNKRVQQSNGSHIDFAKNLLDVNSKLSNYLTNLNGVTASTKGYISSLITLTAQEITATAATVALNTALTMGIGFLIQIGVGVLSKTVQVFDELYISTSEAAEQADILSSSWQKLHTTINKNLKSVNELSTRYVELAKGVSGLGENISLTDNEYTEFLSVSNQLAELAPDLVNFWDVQGNAILKVTDNVKELTDAYKKQAQSIAQKQLASKKDEDGNKHKSIFINYDLQEKENRVWGTFFDHSNREKQSWLQDYLDMDADQLNNAIKKGGFKDSRTQYLQDLLKKHFPDLKGYGDSAVTTDNLSNIRNIFSAELSGIDQEISEAESNIGQYALLVAQTRNEYWGLSEDAYSAVNSFLSTLTSSVIDGLELKSEETTQDFVGSLVTALSNPDTTELDDALLGLFSIDLSNKSIPEAQELVNSYADSLVTAFKTLNPDATITAEDILSQFGSTDVNTLAEAYNTNLDNWSSQASAKTGKSSEVIRAAIESFATRFSVNTQNEIAFFNDCMEKAENDYKKAMALYLEKEQEDASFVDRISQIEALNTGMEQLANIYNDVQDGGNFDWGSILNNEDFKDTFSNLTGVSDEYKTAYDEFIKAVANSPTDIEACQSAFNKLATAYINNSDAMDDLNEETALNTVIQLKQMGVVNAEEVVYEALRKKLAQVQIQKRLLSGEAIDTNKERNELLQLAQDAGIATESLVELKHAIEVLNNPSAWSAEEITKAQEFIDRLADGTYQISYNPLFEGTGLKIDGSAADSAKDAYAELFDFFERRIEVLQGHLDLLEAGMENVFGADAKNTLLSRQSAIVQEEISNYTQAADMYDAMAKQYWDKLSPEWQDKVTKGAVDIELIDNEDLNDNLSGYTEWANKAQDCRVELEGLNAELRQIELNKFNNIVDDYTNQFDLLGQGIENIDAQIGLIEEKGEIVPESFYRQQQSLYNQQLSTLEAQRAAMENQLESVIGTVKQGSAEWLEMVGAIDEVKGQITECKTSIEQMDNAILQLRWDEFDTIRDRFSEIASEAENLVELLNDSLDIKVSDGHGTYTDDAITALGLYAQQYEIARTNVQDYEEAINELKATYDAGKYSTTEYYEKLSELTQGKWDAVNAAEAVEDAIMDLARSRVDEEVESINEEIDAYRKLIDAQLDAIQTEEDLRQKKEDITEASKEVSKIERQLAAMQYDTSAKANAERKLLEEQLAEAKKNLADIEHDYSVKEQQDALNKQMENFEEARNDEIKVLEESLNDREKLINEAFDLVKQNSISVGEAIETIAKGNGITVSQALVDAWKSGETAITGYGQTLTEQSSVFSGVLSNVKGEVIGLQAEAEKAYGWIAKGFGLKSEELILELQASYGAVENLNNIGSLLQDTMFTTLSSEYKVDGLVNAISKIKDAFTGEGGLSDALQEIIDKFRVIDEYQGDDGQNDNGGKTPISPVILNPIQNGVILNPIQNGVVAQNIIEDLERRFKPSSQTLTNPMGIKELDDILASQNPNSPNTLALVGNAMGLSDEELRQLGVPGYAKGGLVTKDDNNPLNAIARAVGEDTIVAAKEGESILTPIQTEAMLKLAPYLNRINDLISSPAAIDRYRNDIVTEGNKSIGNNIQVGSLVTVNGNVDDNNLKKLTEVVRKEINTTFTKWNRDFVYGGY